MCMWIEPFTWQTVSFFFPFPFPFSFSSFSFFPCVGSPCNVSLDMSDELDVGGAPLLFFLPPSLPPRGFEARSAPSEAVCCPFPPFFFFPPPSSFYFLFLGVDAGKTVSDSNRFFFPPSFSPFFPPCLTLPFGRRYGKYIYCTNKKCCCFFLPSLFFPPLLPGSSQCMFIKFFPPFLPTTRRHQRLRVPPPLFPFLSLVFQPRCGISVEYARTRAPPFSFFFPFSPFPFLLPTRTATQEQIRQMRDKGTILFFFLPSPSN